MADNTIKKGTDEWDILQSEILVTFKPGDLISHDWLQDKFNLKPVAIGNHTTTEELIYAINERQFKYMSLVEDMRWDLLENHNAYIRNIRGDGYMILPPREQTTYAYKEAINAIKKELKNAGKIMSNVLPVDMETQSRDNSLRAKFAMLRQMLKGVER